MRQPPPEGINPPANSEKRPQALGQPEGASRCWRQFQLPLPPLHLPLHKRHKDPRHHLDEIIRGYTFITFGHCFGKVGGVISRFCRFDNVTRSQPSHGAADRRRITEDGKPVELIFNADGLTVEQLEERTLGFFPALEQGAAFNVILVPLILVDAAGCKVTAQGQVELAIVLRI